MRTKRGKGNGLRTSCGSSMAAKATTGPSANAARISTHSHGGSRLLRHRPFAVCSDLESYSYS